MSALVALPSYPIDPVSWLFLLMGITAFKIPADAPFHR